MTYRFQLRNDQDQPLFDGFNADGVGGSAVTITVSGWSSPRSSIPDRPAGQLATDGDAPTAWLDPLVDHIIGWEHVRLLEVEGMEGLQLAPCCRRLARMLLRNSATVRDQVRAAIDEAARLEHKAEHCITVTRPS